MALPCFVVSLLAWSYAAMSIYLSNNTPYISLPFLLPAFTLAFVTTLANAPLVLLAQHTPKIVVVAGVTMTILEIAATPLVIGLAAGSVVGAFPG